MNTLIALVAAHVLADFVLQSAAMVREKRRGLVFCGHIAVVALTAALALGMNTKSQLIVLVLFVTLAHAGIDAIKTWLITDRDADAFWRLKIFSLDQIAHLGSLVLAATIWPSAFEAGHWPLWLAPAALAFMLAFTVLFTGIVLATRVGAIVIELLMQGLVDPAAPDGRAKPSAAALRAGVWIGWLERSLVFGFVLLDQFAAIGFVIAAKSILRFEYARKAEQSERVIIGTMASFGWAIGCAVATHRLWQVIL